MNIAVYNFNRVLDGIRDEVIRRGDVVEFWEQADTVIVWQDAVGVLSTMCQEAKKMGKRVIVAEHGLLSINDYIPPLSKPLIGDVFMAWGNVTKEWLLTETDIPGEKIIVTGTTIFSAMGPKIPHKGKNVLFAPRHWQHEIKENLEVAEILKKYDKAYVYTKILADEHDPFRYPNPIISTRTDGDHLKKCYDALKYADVVVGIGEGTFAALAYYMDIPYISVDRWETKTLLGKTYDKYAFESQLSCACKQIRPKKLLEVIDYELAHPESMHELRQAFIDDYLDGADPEYALKKQIEVVYGPQE